jgi:hypothetical protein
MHSAAAAAEQDSAAATKQACSNQCTNAGGCSCTIKACSTALRNTGWSAFHSGVQLPAQWPQQTLLSPAEPTCLACCRVLKATGQRDRSQRGKGTGAGVEAQGAGGGRAGSVQHWRSSTPYVQCSRACPSSWQEPGCSAATKQACSKPMHKNRWLLMHRQGPRHCLANCWLVSLFLRGSTACPTVPARPAASTSTQNTKCCTEVRSTAAAGCIGRHTQLCQPAADTLSCVQDCWWCPTALLLSHQTGGARLACLLG